MAWEEALNWRASGYIRYIHINKKRTNKKKRVALLIL